MLQKSLYQSCPHYHFHRRRWYIMGSHVNVDHKLSLNGRKESCAGFAHWLTARDWHVRFFSRPSLVTSSFQTPSWRKCSARGFVTGLDEAPGAVTEVTSIFLTGYDFIARGAGGGPNHFASHSSDSIPQCIIFFGKHQKEKKISAACAEKAPFWLAGWHLPSERRRETVFLLKYISCIAGSQARIKREEGWAWG